MKQETILVCLYKKKTSGPQCYRTVAKSHDTQAIDAKDEQDIYIYQRA